MGGLVRPGVWRPSVHHAVVVHEHFASLELGLNDLGGDLGRGGERQIGSIEEARAPEVCSRCISLGVTGPCCALALSM